jgi:hypothetical protein
MVDIGAYGQDSYDRVFQNSYFGSKLLKKTLDLSLPAVLTGTTAASPHVLMGDAAFPLHDSLMRPYPGRLYPQKYVDTLQMNGFAISATPVADKCIKLSTPPCNLHRQTYRGLTE